MPSTTGDLLKVARKAASNQQAAQAAARSTAAQLAAGMGRPASTGQVAAPAPGGGAGHRS